MLRASLRIALVVLIVFGCGACSSNRLTVLMPSERFPGTDEQFVSAVKASLENQGFAVTMVDAEAMTKELARTTKAGRLLVLPNSACFPVQAKPSLEAYLKAGGNLLTIGGPALSRQVARVDGQWVTQAMLVDKLMVRAPNQTIIDFGKMDISKIQRDSGTPETEVRIRVVDSGVREAPKGLEVHVASLTFWEFQLVPLTKPFPASDTVTSFWAKGSSNAKQLKVGWMDGEKSNWQAVIDLTPQWKRYIITSDMLKHRGEDEESDKKAPPKFDIRKVKAFKVGLENHDVRENDEPATFWISDVGSMTNPAGDADFGQPTLETISPSYKTYATVAEAYVPTHGAYAGLADSKVFDGPIKTVCSIPRFRGLGFNKTAPHRWIPWLAAKRSDGHIGGAAAAMWVQDDETYKGSIWATFGIEDDAFVATHRSEIAEQIAAMAKRMDDGMFLLSAGTDHASYFDGTPNVGAVVIDLGGRGGAVRVKSSITSDPAYINGQKSVAERVLESSFSLTGRRTVREMGEVKNLPAGFYVATTSLYRGGELIDEIRQPFSVVDSKPVDPAELVTIKGDQFHYKGKPWYSLGINYRPIYTAAMEEGPFWEYWTSNRQYDAEIVDIELDLMKKIGLNTAAIIYPDKKPSVAPALVDFMERAHRHGLKCHVYIEGLEPFNQKPEKTVRLIEEARLWERPAMFAYDTGWEVRMGREKKRALLNAQWTRWIENRYGSLQEAEKDWGFTLRREAEGNVCGPTDEQVCADGPWNRMVAAYRRFCDDVYSRRYMKTAATIRGLDHDHPIGVRSGFDGTGTTSFYALPIMPVDLFSGAKHLDYVSPEGYNFRGKEQAFREGGFTTVYGKFASGGKPVYWAELGCSALPATDEKLEEQRKYYEKIYRTFYETRSAGSAAWWWPGYLIWENSDFSIINPDFSLRPAAREFTKMSKLVNDPVPAKEPDYWIEINRDPHAIGYAAILKEKRAEYGKAILEGKTVGLRTKGTGTDSSNFPQVAVGDTALNGRNPPKFLNGEFNSLEIQDATGKWVAVEDGGSVSVKAGAPVYARASLGNIAESTWLGSKAGAVMLKAGSGNGVVLAPIAKDTPFLSDAQVAAFKVTDSVDGATSVGFQLVVGQIFFGEKRYVTLVPAK